MVSLARARGRRSAQNPLTAASKWKVFDNLRRSLVPLSFVLFLLASWYLLPSLAWFTTALATAVLASPFLFHVLSAAVHMPSGETWRQHLVELTATLSRTLLQCALGIAFLPQRAHYFTDAILRTLYRLFVSRQNLLEWETAEATERRLSQRNRSLWVTLGWITLACAGIAATLPRTAFPWVAPILALWFVSPWLAHFLSRPLVPRAEAISSEDQAALRPHRATDLGVL